MAGGDGKSNGQGSRALHTGGVIVVSGGSKNDLKIIRFKLQIIRFKLQTITLNYKLCVFNYYNKIQFE
jgi:hypothetical protein